MGKINNDNYVVIQGWMRNELNLKGNELMVYAIIYGFSQDGENDFTGSAAYMADWIGSTKQTVFNILKSLTDKGFIKKTDVYNNGVKFCHYSALPPVKNFDRGVVKKFDGGSQKILPNNIDINNINNIDNIYSQNKDFDEGKSPDYEAVVKMYHDICKSFPKVMKLTDKRKKAIKARLKNYTLDDIKKVFENAEQSEFLKGNNDRGWKADFDFLMTESKMIGVLEGKYNFANGRKKTNIETNQSFGDELTRSQDDLCRMIGFNV